MEALRTLRDADVDETDQAGNERNCDVTMSTSYRLAVVQQLDLTN